KAGCNLVKLGIETGSRAILEETDKGVTFDQIRNAARMLNRQNLFWSGYFMIGLPMETEEDILQTHGFMKELNPYYAALGVYNPFPNTTLFDRGVELGLLRKEVDLSHFFNTHPKDYYFVDPRRRVLHIENERYLEIVDWMMGKFHQHNKKISNLMRRGWSRRRAYAHDCRLLFGDVRKAIRWIGVK
ncbi:MAG: radical SAM protein, partial [Planctomycetota bacterium]